MVLPGEKHEVTCLAVNHYMNSIAVGYTDGTLKTYDLESGDNISIFSGHRTAITAIKYDKQGVKVATGAKVYFLIL